MVARLIISLLVTIAGLIFCLINWYAEQLPILLGQFGGLFLLAAIPQWLSYSFFIGGYILSGLHIYNWFSWIASGPRGFIFNPGRTLSFIPWVVAWPVTMPICMAYNARRYR